MIRAALAVDDGIAQPPLAQGHVRAVALDSAGNRYLAGFFFGEVDFNPGAGLDVKTSAGESDIFVTRFNADGGYAWTQTFGGTAADSAAAIAVFGKSVFVAGSFASANAPAANAGGTDAIVLAFDASTGATRTNFGTNGAQTFGGAGDDMAAGMVAAGKTLFVCGSFTSANAGVGGPGTLATRGDEDAFVLALSASHGKAVGSFGLRGVQTLSGANIERATGLALAGNTLFASGFLLPDATGIGGPGAITGMGGLDWFVVALDWRKGRPRLSFDFDGVQLGGGKGNDLAFGLATANGAVYVAGTFEGTDAGIGTLGNVAASGGFDAFVAALNATTGAAHPFFGEGGIQTFGGTSDDAAAAITVAAARVHVTGAFTSVNAGLGGTGTLASAGGGDAFVLHLHTFTGGAFGGETQTLGGTADDGGFGIAARGAQVFTAGSSFSGDVAIDGAGSLNALGWNGFLLGLAPLGGDATAFDSFDTDGDDFPDELEAALGTSPVEFLSTPIGREPGSPLALTVHSLAIRLNFTTPDPAKDKITLRGKVAIPAGFAVAGQPVALSVGGAVRTFTLNSLGNAATSDGAFSLRVKNQGGVALAQEAGFVATLKRGSLRAQLDDEGLTGDATIAKPGVARTVKVALLLGGQLFLEAASVTYTAVASQKGVATGP